MTEKENYEVPHEGHGKRLDAWLAQLEPAISRVRWQELIKDGVVQVNGKSVKPNQKLITGAVITYEIPEEEEILEPEPENIPLDVLYEDDEILVINKQAGLVVHPAPGNESGTLVNALLYHCGDELERFGDEQRPGIVHRLDKDTSGTMVIAKTEEAYLDLVDQFKERDTHKEYIGIVWGTPRPRNGTVETNIARSDKDRKKMAVYELDGEHGKYAITHYRVEEQFTDCALMRFHIETGRTHQIRVHSAHIKHPIVGDSVYARPRTTKLPAPFPRQMLHAQYLVINHPETGEELTFEAPIPDDFQTLLDALRATKPQ